MEINDNKERILQQQLAALHYEYAQKSYHNWYKIKHQETAKKHTRRAQELGEIMEQPCLGNNRT